MNILGTICLLKCSLLDIFFLITHWPLQPCNHAGPDEQPDDDGANADGDGEFDPSDVESESEDDSWFDTLLETKLSELPGSQIVFDNEDRHSDSEIPPSQPRDTQPLDDSKPLKDECTIPDRPVARPLQSFDSPILKEKTNSPMVVEASPEYDLPPAEKAAKLRAERIAFLKAQLAELEVKQAEVAKSDLGSESGPVLFFLVELLNLVHFDI